MPSKLRSSQSVRSKQAGDHRDDHQQAVLMCATDNFPTHPNSHICPKGKYGVMKGSGERDHTFF